MTLKNNAYLSVIGNPCSEIIREETSLVVARTSYNRITWISPAATKEEIKEIVQKVAEIDINQEEDYHKVRNIYPHKITNRG